MEPDTNGNLRGGPRDMEITPNVQQVDSRAIIMEKWIDRRA